MALSIVTYLRMLGDPEAPASPQPGPARGCKHRLPPAALSPLLCDCWLLAIPQDAPQACQAFPRLLTAHGVRDVVPCVVLLLPLCCHVNGIQASCTRVPQSTAGDGVSNINPNTDGDIFGELTLCQALFWALLPTHSSTPPNLMEPIIGLSPGWEWERGFDQSKWKVVLPFPKMRRSKWELGRWEMGACWTSQWRAR